eukprot:g5324.t1
MAASGWAPVPLKEEEEDVLLRQSELYMMTAASAPHSLCPPSLGDHVTLDVAGPLEPEAEADEEQWFRVRVQLGSVACPRGWDVAVQRMLVGEHARLRCKQSYAQGAMVALGGDRRDAVAGRRMSRRLSLLAVQSSAGGARASLGAPSISEGAEEEGEEDDVSAPVPHVAEPQNVFEVKLAAVHRLRRPQRALQWLQAVVV